MNLADYLIAAAATLPSHLRFGQHLFNQLPPDLAERLRATEDDPFSDNGRIPRFLMWLARQPEVIVVPPARDAAAAAIVREKTAEGLATIRAARSQPPGMFAWGWAYSFNDGAYWQWGMSAFSMREAMLEARGEFASDGGNHPVFLLQAVARGWPDSNAPVGAEDMIDRANDSWGDFPDCIAREDDTIVDVEGHADAVADLERRLGAAWHAWVENSIERVHFMKRYGPCYRVDDKLGTIVEIVKAPALAEDVRGDDSYGVATEIQRWKASAAVRAHGIAMTIAAHQADARMRRRASRR